MNLGHLDFDIVSDFDIRISYFAGLGISTLVVSALQIKLFMQNKAKFRKSQMNVSPFITMNYEQLTMNYEIKNEPKTNPNEPNLQKSQMNATSFLTMNYEHRTMNYEIKNEPKTNPKRTQFPKSQAGSGLYIGVYCKSVEVSGCTFYGNYEDGLELQAGSGNNTIINCTSSGIRPLLMMLKSIVKKKTLPLTLNTFGEKSKN